MPCVINLWNDAVPWLTLNNSTNVADNMFLTDTSFSIPQTVQTLVAKNSPSEGSMTYNITENALLEISWKLQKQDFVCSAWVTGSTQYTVSGYDQPYTNGDSVSFILHVYPTGS